VHRAGDGPVTPDQFKNSKAGFVTNDCLAVDQSGEDRQRLNRHLNEGEAMCEVVSVPSNELHTGRAAPRQNAEAVMLDFVQPTRAGRRGLRGRR
jgi:hypothetical protein